MIVTKTQNQLSTLRANVSSTAASMHFQTAVTLKAAADQTSFAHKAPLFGATKKEAPRRSGIGGAFDLIGRIFNREVGEGHIEQDEQDKLHPEAKFVEEREALVLKLHDAERAQAGVTARYKIALKALKELEKNAKKEQDEADAAALEFEATKTNKGEDHLETKAALHIAETEDREAQEAQKAYLAQKEITDAMEGAAKTAESAINDLRKAITEINRQMTEALGKKEQAEGLEVAVEVKKTAEEIQGTRVGVTAGTANLIEAQNLRLETAKAQLGSTAITKPTEESTAEAAVRARLKDKHVSSAIEERLARLKAGQAGAASKAATAGKPSGNPLDEVTQ